MMRFLIRYLPVALLVALASGCGGDAFTGGGGAGGGGATAAATIRLLVSNPQLTSDAATEDKGVTVTALVRDASNALLAGADVVFAADSGALKVVSGTTDENGTATAVLTTAGDPRNRTITVTASSGEASDSVQVDVTGTGLSISGPDALVLGQTASFTVNLTDASGAGIGGEVVALASSAGNSISAATTTTDANGQVVFDVTATTGGTDTLTATALGLQATRSVTVSADTFEITAPAAGQEVTLGTATTVSATWLKSGAPQVGETISFTATRGTLSAASAVTDANGVASVTISADNAGPAVITAENPESTSTTVEIEFVATDADTINVQADPPSIGPTEQSSITAVVRDPAGNLVKNKRVNFTLEDVTGGSISVASDTTDSQGRARTVYTASNTTSEQGGVKITATVDDDPTVSGTVALSVGRRALFVAIGTGNELTVPDLTTYEDPYTVTVTDVDGKPVSGVTVDLSVTPTRYRKGYYVAGVDEDGNFISWVALTTALCDNEDVNRNGVLDPGEDLNGNGTLEPGNHASVSPFQVETDQDGQGDVQLNYAKTSANWVDVDLRATIDVAGTESFDSAIFTLRATAEDLNNEKVAPPGADTPFGPGSPFGVASSCADPD